MCARRTIHPQYVETFWYDKVRVCQIQQQQHKINRQLVTIKSKFVISGHYCILARKW